MAKTTVERRVLKFIVKETARSIVKDAIKGFCTTFMESFKEEWNKGLQEKLEETGGLFDCTACNASGEIEGEECPVCEGACLVDKERLEEIAQVA